MSTLFGRAFRKEAASEPARLSVPEMPPRPAEHRPPAEQRVEWWGGRGAREDGWDPCTGAGPMKTGSDEEGDAA